MYLNPRYVTLFERSTLVEKRPMKSHSPVCLSARASVTKFCQYWINSFFWYCTYLNLTMISSDWQSQIFENKKFGGRNLDPTCLNQVQNEVCCHFIEFQWKIFFGIADDNCLPQFLTSSRGETDKKKKFSLWRASLCQLGQNRARN